MGFRNYVTAHVKTQPLCKQNYFCIHKERTPGNHTLKIIPLAQARAHTGRPPITRARRGGNVTPDAIHSRTVLAILTKRLTAITS